jgi:hypothetical protein
VAKYAYAQSPAGSVNMHTPLFDDASDSSNCMLLFLQDGYQITRRWSARTRKDSKSKEKAAI